MNCYKSLPKHNTIIEDPDNIIQDFKTEVRFYFINNKIDILRGGSRGRVQGVRTPPSPLPPLELTCGFLIQLVFCKKKNGTMWFIGVEVEQETSAPPPKKNPGSAPDTALTLMNAQTRS